MQVCITEILMFGNEIVGYGVQFEDEPNRSVFQDSLILFMKDDKNIPCNFLINDNTIEVNDNVPIRHITKPSEMRCFSDFLDIL